ncbi:DEAD/DEAH box helicase [Haloarchaeobius sp. TZWSO28]|uniref:DEAD/DEAH box helicase n=1 Tax=Haloarchaeobius sp. TZWSO28 TaxID=3446119 RepID=UPI003EB931A0
MSSDTPQRDLPITGRTLADSFPRYDDQIVHVATQDAREAQRVPAGEVLRPQLARRLPFDPYTHQAEALNRLADGENVCVATSTSSGKTWVYALQIARNYLDDPDSTALLVYPTKALSRDQEQQLSDLFDDLGLDLTVAVYDGDTPQDRRKHIRENADVVITNFAGVNVYLGHHRRWHDFYSSCALLVVDESHTYTGVHGMHVAWTIRRLRRVLDHTDSDPQLVCTSATIGNPAEHSERLTGAPFSVVDEDGSPHGRRDIVFWNPPLDTDSLPEDADLEEYKQARASAGDQAASLTAHLGLHGIQTLTFTRSRQGTEIGAKQAVNAARKHPLSGYLSVEPYHAGHGKQTRRGTEYELKSGSLDAVISTNALELGIDIGSVDATVLTGYPGTRQSFWQQLGRSGRGDSDALSVLVARADAIDQYILDEPAYLLGDNVEDAVVGLENNPVYAQHVRCAAHELPLTTEDRQWFDGERLDRAVEMFKDVGELVGDLDHGVTYNGGPRPQMDISMYNTGGTQFDVRRRDGDIDMEPIDKERAYREFHKGALVLHSGVEYEVVAFEEDRPNPYVELQSVHTNEYSETLSDIDIHDLEEERSRDLGDGWRVCWGTGLVDVHYSHFRRRDIESGEITQPLRPTGLGPLSMRTQLMWVELPQGMREACVERVVFGDGDDDDDADADREAQTVDDLPGSEIDQIFMGGLHAAEHGMIKLAPLELRMDKSDLGGLSVSQHPETGKPTWFIYDGVSGGLGFSKAIYEVVETLATTTRNRIDGCACKGTRGCPSCVMDSQCGSDNEPLHTDAAVDVLSELLDRLGRTSESGEN